MGRPALEVADIFRDHGAAWRNANAGRVSLDQLKVMSAIERCRTAALGGHVARCEDCAHIAIAYNSCLMGRASNGESALCIRYFSVNFSSSSLHNVGLLRPRQCGHRWPVTNGDEHVGDVLLGSEDAGAPSERAERTIP